MINAMNNVSFGYKINDPVDLNKPQANARPQTNPATAPAQPDTVEVSGKKKHTAAKVIGGIAVTAAAVAGLLYAGNKTNFFKNLGKHIPDGIKNASWLQWAKEPTKAVAKAFDTAGEHIGTWTKAGKDFVVTNANKGWEYVTGLFHRNPNPPAPTV